MQAKRILYTILCLSVIYSCEEKDPEVDMPHIYNLYPNVDLGLSVRWGEYNLGAENYWEYGDYYAWGETSPRDNFDYSPPRGTIVYNDPATEQIGSGWHLPNKEQWEELIANCDLSYVKNRDAYSGRVCAKVTSRVKGYEGASIYFSLPGYISKDKPTYGAEDIGYYWSCSSESEGSAHIAKFSYYRGVTDKMSSSFSTNTKSNCGISARPVADK